MREGGSTRKKSPLFIIWQRAMRSLWVGGCVCCVCVCMRVCVCVRARVRWCVCVRARGSTEGVYLAHSVLAIELCR